MIVGGTCEIIGNVPTKEIKESMSRVLHKANTVTPSVAVSSVLTCRKGANPEQLAEVNNAIKHVCNDMNATFVDHRSNVTFKNGDADASVFHADGIRLSASRVDKVLSNLSLPRQTSKRQWPERARHSAIRVDEIARRSITRVNRVTLTRSTKSVKTSRDNGMCGGQRTDTL